MNNDYRPIGDFWANLIGMVFISIIALAIAAIIALVIVLAA